jgi:hypothetical protein
MTEAYHADRVRHALLSVALPSVDLAQTRDRYVRAHSRAEKSRLLTEAMAVTGYHRKALVRA